MKVTYYSLWSYIVYMRAMHVHRIAWPEVNIFRGHSQTGLQPPVAAERCLTSQCCRSTIHFTRRNITDEDKNKLGLQASSISRRYKHGPWTILLKKNRRAHLKMLYLTFFPPRLKWRSRHWSYKVDSLQMSWCKQWRETWWSNKSEGWPTLFI